MGKDDGVFHGHDLGGGEVRHVAAHASVGQGGGQHDIHGGPYGDDVQIDLGALQATVLRACVDIAASDVHVGAHGHKALDMLINGTGAQVTAARRRHLGGPEPAQQRADKIIGSPDLAGHHVGYPGIADTGAVDVHRGTVHGADICTQFLENFQNKGDVADLGNVLDPAHAVHQQGGRNDGHRGVLGAADLDISIQRFAPVNHILRQNRTFYPHSPDPLAAGSAYQRPDHPKSGRFSHSLAACATAAHSNAMVL